MMRINLIPAGYGDCIIISIEEKCMYNILIDGGVTKTYQKFIKSKIHEMVDAGQKLNLMICTHMDNDHICGLIETLKKEKAENIENIWYNGFLQIIDEKYYSKTNSEYTIGDTEILDKIIFRGMISDEEQEVGINEGMSLSVLIEKNEIPLNMIADGKAISTKGLKGRYEIEKDIFVTIIGPSEKNIMEIEKYWKKDMISRNYMFRAVDKIKLMEAFEYQLECIKKVYACEKVRISEHMELEKYMGDLLESDSSIVNQSSISFILEYHDKKYLFLGDSVMDEEMIEKIQNAVGFKCRFSAIKLPHHGSRYNITREFIDRYTADEYYCLTNSKKYGHPDLEVLTTIICKDQNFKRLVFNYPIEKADYINKDEWKEKYKYDVIIGNGENVVERIFE